MPLRAISSPRTLERQHQADRRFQTARENLPQALPFLRVVEAIVNWIDVDRQLALALQVVERIFEGFTNVIGIDAEPQRQGVHELLRVSGPKIAVRSLGKQRRIMPERNAVGPPVASQRPARQRLAGIPLSLTKMQQAARSEAPPQAIDQALGQPSLLGAKRGGIPFLAIHVVDGDEGRFAAHGEANVAGQKLLIDLGAERFDALPLLGGVGQRDARVFVNARHRHLVRELHFALVDAAGNRSRRGRLGRGR